MLVWFICPVSPICYCLICRGILLITGFYPFWIKYRSQTYFKIALDGVNSTAIGLIIAAVFLLWFRAVKSDAFMACIALLSAACTGRWNVSAPLVVIGSGVLGAIRYGISLL